VTTQAADGGLLIQGYELAQDGQPTLVQETSWSKRGRQGAMRRTTRFDAAGSILACEIDTLDSSGRLRQRGIFDAAGRPIASTVVDYDHRGRWTSRTTRLDEAGRVTGGDVVTGNRRGRILSREELGPVEAAGVDEGAEG
jgi:hypothetical protein